ANIRSASPSIPSSFVITLPSPADWGWPFKRQHIQGALMMTSKRALLAAAAFALLPYGLAANAATTVSPERAAASISTAFDSTIDRVVASRVTAGQLNASLAVVLREQMQMQFLSLTAAEQQSLLESTRDLSSAEQVNAAAVRLNQAVVSAARAALT